MTLEVLPLPLLHDNYAYLLVHRGSRSAVVVDPSEGGPVLAALEAEGLTLRAVWCTHHHPDHVGGVPELVARIEGLTVVGSAYDSAHRRIPHQTEAVSEGSLVTHGGVAFEVLEIPGHTLGAIAFFGGGMVFTGDTLFTGGCGRVFEGTMSMMRASLDRLRVLPPDTLVYCGHEYTVRNLEFAHLVEPMETAITARLDAARAARAEGRPTVPATIAEELSSNPFLRWDASAVREWAERRGPASDDDGVFTQLREAKNAF